MSLRTRAGELFFNLSKGLMGTPDGADTAFAINQLYGGNNDAKKLGKYKGIVFAAVNLISDKVKGYEPIFNKRQADSHLEPILTHPLLELFKHPSKGVSQSEFFKAVSIYKNILGESFWYIPLGSLTGKPNITKGSEIFLLPPEKMGLKIDDTGEVIGYALRRSNGTEVLFRPEEIKLHKTFNPMNPYRGYGIVETALDYIETEEGARRFTRNFYKNNGVPPGILSVKGNISKENFRIFAERWREQTEGSRNAGKIAIVRDSDIDFTKTSLGLNEIDMVSLKDLTVTEVLRMFRVPKALLGEETNMGMSRANVETFEYLFAKETIEPELEMLDDSIQELLDRFYPKDQLIVTHDNIIPEDKEFELRERQAGVDVWLTRNEIRQEEGLDDEPGADVLRAGAMTVPIGPADIETPNEAGGAEDEETKGHIILRRTIKKKTLNTEVKEAFRLTLQRKQRAYEARFSDALAPVLKKQKKEVLDNWQELNKSSQGLVKAIGDRLIDIPGAIKAFHNALFPVELALAQDQGKLALNFAGDEESDFEVTAEVQKFIRDALERVSYHFNEDTLEFLTQSVADGLAEGKSSAQIAKGLAGIYDNDVTGYRAERLSRTETLRASNEATRMAYKQTGYVTSMQWYANPGACAFCEELSGTEVGLEETFADLGDSIDTSDGASYTVDYNNVETPPLHPNCQCTIIPVRE